MELPLLHCRPLPSFDPADWDATSRAFSGAEPCALGQFWRRQPQTLFAPATVRAAWSEDALWVYGELTDVDIFNTATRLNERTWETGDCLEIFLWPNEGETYYEFHVTPENQRLQLRLPIEPPGAFHDFDGHLIAEPLLQSWTQVDAPAQRWRVVAKIPALVVAGCHIADGDMWRFSFCRYDYTRAEEEPVMSSSSPHTKPGFHRRHEWGQLIFNR